MLQDFTIFLWLLKLGALVNLYLLEGERCLQAEPCGQRGHDLRAARRADAFGGAGCPSRRSAGAPLSRESNVAARVRPAFNERSCGVSR
jgi:hypothetical protein